MLGDGYLVGDTDLCLVPDFDGPRMTIPQRDPAPAPPFPHSSHRPPMPPLRNSQGNKEQRRLPSQCYWLCPLPLAGSAK